MKKGFTTIIFSLILAAAAILGIIFKNQTAFLAQATASLEASQQVDKSQAAPGEVLTYTFYVGNNGSEVLHDVLVSEHFADDVDYQAGSTYATKDSNTVQVDDNWVTPAVNHVNLGALNPNQQARLTFKAVIKNSAPNGATIETTSQVKSNETPDWLQRAAQTIVAAAVGNTRFEGGNTFLAFNNTTQSGSWTDPVGAVVGNVIEFKFRIVNSGNSEARNSKVRVQLAWDPQNPSNTLVNTATVTADNAQAMSDNVTINLSGQSGYLWPKAGHYNFVGTTGLFNCPGGCSMDNQFLWEPMLVGSIPAGAAVEVLFKADIPLIASPSPSPSVSPSPSPSPIPDKAQFAIRKFNDTDKDGNWDGNEGSTGREWKFQYRLNDGDWHDYFTPAGTGWGDTITVDKDTKIEVREIEQSGWTNSTGLTLIKILNEEKVYYFDFGNWQPPIVVTASPPTVVPQAGAGVNWLPWLSLAALGVALQLLALVL